jgi:hypothetical protein
MKDIEFDFGVEFSRLMDDFSGLELVLAAHLPARKPGVGFAGKVQVSGAQAEAIDKAVAGLQAQLAKYRAAQMNDPEWRAVIFGTESD